MRVNKPGFLASVLALVLISGIIAPASDLSVNVRPIEPAEDYELSDGLQPLKRNWTIQVTFVGYSESKINQTLFLQTLPSWHDANYSTGIVRHRLNYTLVFADDTYEQNLKSNMSAYSNPSAIGTRLNETIFLSYLNGTTAAQDALSSRSGIAIDGPAAESWIASNPALETSNINWNLYLLNFTELDSSDHANDHWFSYPLEDPDSGRQIDWFTLPTGEVLENIVYQYVGAAGKNTNVLLDPSADQWYLRYAMLQYNSSLPLDGSWPLHMGLDLDDIQRMNNLELAEGKNNLSTYLGAYCRDVMSNLFSPGTESNHGGLNPRGWFNMLLETVNLQLRVFTVDSDIVPDAISWTLNDTIIREMFSTGLWTQTSVTAEYESLEDAPGWEALYWDHAETIEGATYVNGTDLAVDIDI
ncbi:MAG: hypothetical protein ACFFAY_13335, partial [Promethearchaeota archaeon]